MYYIDLECAVTYLDCDHSENACPSTETVVLTCEINSLYLQWIINNIELDFTDIHDVNYTQTSSDGLFLAKLIVINTDDPMIISTLKFNYSLVGNGVTIKCIDGNYGINTQSGEHVQKCITKTKGILI